MKKLIMLVAVAGFIALIVKEFPAVRREMKILRM